MARLYLQIWMRINALKESEDFERCIRKQRWITAEPHDSRRCPNSVCRSPRSFPTPRDINYRWSLWQETISNNPVGRSPGRFAKKRESALMPLSPGNIFATNPLPSPWVPLGLPGGLPPGLAADTRIKRMLIYVNPRGNGVNILAFSRKCWDINSVIRWEK